MQWEERLREEMQGILLDRKKILAVYLEKMKGVSPLDKMKQGYAFLQDETGRNISDIRKVQVDDLITAYLKNGKITAKVIGKEDVEWEKR